jgi:hypothetical protein
MSPTTSLSSLSPDRTVTCLLQIPKNIPTDLPLDGPQNLTLVTELVLLVCRFRSGRDSKKEVHRFWFGWTPLTLTVQCWTGWWREEQNREEGRGLEEEERTWFGWNHLILRTLTLTLRSWTGEGEGHPRSRTAAHGKRTKPPNETERSAGGLTRASSPPSEPTGAREETSR